MEIPSTDLIAVLSQFNPWWRGESVPDLPAWKRAAFNDLRTWVVTPPVPRAVLLTGARQVGKTTLLLQVIEDLLASGVPAANILYATFDHPLLKLSGIDNVLSAWREREPKAQGQEYLFLDEAQYLQDWGTWIKHQVDFNKQRRIVFTGSATPLIEEHQESGVGRWHNIKLATLSYYEYLKLKNVSIPEIPSLRSLTQLFDWPASEFYRTAETSRPHAGHFHDYLIRGGFPQTAVLDSMAQAQRLLREDIIDKVLKRDMTAIYGVRRVVALEYTFLYLCMHNGGILDVGNLCKSLELKRPTVHNFLDLLEATHLIYKLPPLGYGKNVLRGRFKVYMADPAIAPAVLLKGKELIEDATQLGIATEAAVCKHLVARHYQQNVRFTYWKDRRDKEVDLLAEIAGKVIPFEVKYRGQVSGSRDLDGLLALCREKGLERAYVVTRSMDDFGPLPHVPEIIGTKIMRIPATMLCYWLGESELMEQGAYV